MPDVDTVLFLRPTESATLFLQQLGRGLRRTRDKAVLTVLDFVGHHRKEFRFDQRLRALTGETRRGLERTIERGLPVPAVRLPDRHGPPVPADRAREHSRPGRQPLAADGRGAARRTATRILPTFLQRVRPRAVRRPSRGHLVDELRRDGRAADATGGAEAAAQTCARPRPRRRPSPGEAIGSLLADDAPAYADLNPAEQRLAEMLFFSLWPGGGGHASIEAGLSGSGASRPRATSSESVIDLAFERAPHVTIA